MKEIYGDLFEQDADAICITTNGFVKTSGECVMGRGCAQTAAQKWPALPLAVGKLIQQHGSRAMVVAKLNRYRVVMFPVKPVSEPFNGTNTVNHMAKKFKVGDLVPGWACKARIDLILLSAIQLEEIASKRGWQRVILPRPGCGAGELKWEDVKPRLEAMLDDRFQVITWTENQITQ
jgi:hypothetical protein